MRDRTEHCREKHSMTFSVPQHSLWYYCLAIVPVESDGITTVQVSHRLLLTDEQMIKFCAQYTLGACVHECI